MRREGVTAAFGVPTIWQSVLSVLDEGSIVLSSLRRVVVGGSACPPNVVEGLERHGIEVRHAWGMTELSPTGTQGTLKNSQLHLGLAERAKLKMTQGRPLFGVQWRIVDSVGSALDHDGKSAGELQVKGPWVARSYYHATGASVPLIDGWFPTGDVATIDSHGYMTITDRTKDLIKSGGEWISSIQLENIALMHPAVAMAACVGVRHPKWDERPVIVVTLKDGRTVEKHELLSMYDGQVAKWQVPDDVILWEEMPLGPTGKVQKKLVRERLINYVHPDGCIV